MKSAKLIVATVIAVTCLASAANAAWLTQQVPANTVNVTPGTTWSTIFGATQADFINEVYAITGKSNTTSPGGLYEVPVVWSAGTVTLDDWNWQYGELVYHFHTSGNFAGGTVLVDFGYIQPNVGRVRHTIGVSTVAPSISMDWGGIDAGWKTTMTSSVDVWGDYPGITGWGYLDRTVTLNLPAGQDFYLGITGNSSVTDEIFLHNIQVAVPSVPEPGSILALVTGLAGLTGFGIRRRK